MRYDEKMFMEKGSRGPLAVTISGVQIRFLWIRSRMSGP